MGFLTLDKLSKVYGDFAAARDIDLSVAKGEFVSLLGPSGCGKTTTLQMIAGLVEPTTGTITLDGRDITRETLDEDFKRPPPAHRAWALRKS